MTVTEKYEALIKRIRSERKARKLSQKDAAEILGIKQPNYSKIESGAFKIRVEQLIALSIAFDMEVADFFKPSELDNITLTDKVRVLEKRVDLLEKVCGYDEYVE